jgi:hypothetical protein
VDVLTRIAQPVLEATAAGRLHERMPVHDWEEHREAFTHFEAFARTLAGVAPWLELGPDDTAEGRLRSRFIDLARRALINATDPRSADYMGFDSRQGDQPLVETAYLAYALMRAPGQLWQPLTAEQQENVLDVLRAARTIELTRESNWVLFPAMVEAALWDLGADFDPAPIESAVEWMDEWYEGDGVYGDGWDVAWDYYNSYVIHPMLLQVLRVADEHDHALADEALPRVMARAKRHAQVLERLISPEGTIPIMGRSSNYRFAAFHHLAYMALIDELPEGPHPGAIRSGITTVVRRMVEAPGTFDANGWLQSGAVGHQPGLTEAYNATGSLYVTLTGLVHLGLPAGDPFWRVPGADWTQKRIWAGQDVQQDHALEYGVYREDTTE